MYLSIELEISVATGDDEDGRRIRSSPYLVWQTVFRLHGFSLLFYFLFVCDSIGEEKKAKKKTAKGRKSSSSKHTHTHTHSTEREREREREKRERTRTGNELVPLCQNGTT